MLDICSEAGVTVIDTADMYSFGGAEEILGEALQGQRQQFVHRHAKCSCAWARAPHDIGLSRKHIVESCEGSLRRLRTDYLDVYMCHEPDQLVPVEETMRAYRRPGQPGQGPLHRLLEPLGVARDEGARRLGPPLVPALHRAAGQLLAAGARRRARDGADGPRSGRRDHGVEPAALRAAVGEVPARRASLRNAAQSARCAGHGRSRAALPDRRRADGDRAGARRLAGAGGAELGA